MNKHSTLGLRAMKKHIILGLRVMQKKKTSFLEPRVEVPECVSISLHGSALVDHSRTVQTILDPCRPLRGCGATTYLLLLHYSRAWSLVIQSLAALNTTPNPKPQPPKPKARTLRPLTAVTPPNPTLESPISQPYTLHLQLSTLNPQPSTLNPTS